ncbi:MAG: hypothetical protein K2X86_16320 [Cytophagaceae bacterium]|nr:hypothetical protein [Cytophagaceae bacterium]
MKKSMHIPSADSILWKTICGILSNSYSLRENFKEKTVIGKKLNTEDIKSLIKKKETENQKLSLEKNEIEKALVKIESEHVLGKYSSKSVYEKLKRELNNKYKAILIQIEDINNSLTDIGNKENWLTWLDWFGAIIKKKEKISDIEKKDFLSRILENIIVNYDYAEKLHKLKVNFKLPVLIEEFVKKKGGRTSARKYSKSSISLANSIDQPFIVENYSTVTDLARFLG